MKFSILVNGDEGFRVVWLGPGSVDLASIDGFATHQQAQGFVQDLLCRVMKTFQNTN